jgi:hypothetical protein
MKTENIIFLLWVIFIGYFVFNFGVYEKGVSLSSIQVEPCQKVIAVTWKDGEPWVLHRNMYPSELPEKYVFEQTNTHRAMTVQESCL